MKTKLLSLLLLMPLLFTGCSSIVDGRAQHVKINSTPTGATFSIYDKEGVVVTTNTTPANLILNRRHGYFNGEDYKMIFEAPGYYPYEVHVKSTVDGWYFGNLLFGGLIGFIVVDPLTGAMYTLKPDTLDVHLVSNTVALTPEELKVAEAKANLPPVKEKPVSSPKSTGKNSRCPRIVCENQFSPRQRIKSFPRECCEHLTTKTRRHVGLFSVDVEETL